MYSSSPPCNGVHSILLIFAMEDVVYSGDRGQRVRHVLHSKIEDKEKVVSFIVKMRSMIHTPLLGREEECAVYTSSHPRG